MEILQMAHFFDNLNLLFKDMYDSDLKLRIPLKNFIKTNFLPCTYGNIPGYGIPFLIDFLLEKLSKVFFDALTWLFIKWDSKELITVSDFMREREKM